MCFSPKIKTPKVKTESIRAIDPAPLTEEPKGILFGGEEDNDSGTSSEVPTGGKKSLKVKLDDSVEKSKKADSAAAKKKSKSGIRTSVFKKK
ncbi:hypothetical protein P483_14 [Escherichia phage P483]|uniref:Virion protein n=3 Tax=Berlinvirus TaxID=2732677 RepID=A0A3G8F095_9CAUD|nr:hypothetical protein V419_gp31 [Erwinia phage FE44]YP_009200596.1 hypothetical protein P483_14 [Escherichia phage P483]YP_009816576.1 virion protein [Yersinia phage PYPS50]QQM13710.1 virion protein [Yersinia phage PYps50T]QQO91366.1 virion protein [Yersinia phage PYps49T]AGY36928.1 hypothetical protein FIVT_0027 [Erwinia phage FE44]AJF40449.1 hypothetical protein P483_14 [Escherichia phage P483]AZF87551.1 virion protein [Yersinia phage PYPS50]